MQRWNARALHILKQLVCITVWIDERQHGRYGFGSVEARTVKGKRKVNEDVWHQALRAIVLAIVGEYAIKQRAVIKVRRHN